MCLKLSRVHVLFSGTAEHLSVPAAPASTTKSPDMLAKWTAGTNDPAIRVHSTALPTISERARGPKTVPAQIAEITKCHVIFIVFSFKFKKCW